jgi:hypothetical protein
MGTMKPVHTITSDRVYVGPPGVGDLHCQRVEPGLIRSVWVPTLLERQAITEGANVALWVYTEPIPPVAVTALLCLIAVGIFRNVARSLLEGE